MKPSKVLIAVSILVIVLYIVIMLKFVTTPISEMPGWVFWLIYK